MRKSIAMEVRLASALRRNRLHNAEAVAAEGMVGVNDAPPTTRIDSKGRSAPDLWHPQPPSPVKQYSDEEMAAFVASRPDLTDG
jgi:hypothetical protein